MTRVRRRGLTVVEVLVALAVFALLAAATAGVLSTALRLQAEAGRVAHRIAAFGPAAAGLDADGTGTSVAPSCDETSDADDSDANVAGEPCLQARSRCHVTAEGAAVCDGRGPLLRSDWAWSGTGSGSATAVTAWRWAP